MLIFRARSGEKVPVCPSLSSPHFPHEMYPGFIGHCMLTSRTLSGCWISQGLQFTRCHCSLQPASSSQYWSRCETVSDCTVISQRDHYKHIRASSTAFSRNSFDFSIIRILPRRVKTRVVTRANVYKVLVQCKSEVQSG